MVRKTPLVAEPQLSAALGKALALISAHAPRKRGGDSLSTTTSVEGAFGRILLLDASLCKIQYAAQYTPLFHCFLAARKQKVVMNKGFYRRMGTDIRDSP